MWRLNTTFPAVMTELIQRHAAVIVGDTSPAIAAKTASSTIPIVFLTGTDPVSLGLVTSFNHPGGNATGVSFVNSELDGKRLGLLHELLARTGRSRPAIPIDCDQPLRLIATTDSGQSRPACGRR